MSQTGGITKPKAKLGYLGISLILGALLVLLVIVSNLGNEDEEANPYAAPVDTSEPVSVSTATEKLVKDSCARHLNEVAANTSKGLGGVEPKPYEVTGITFTGEVEEVSLPYDRTAYEVPLEYSTQLPDGTTSTQRETCRYNELNQHTEILNS